MTAGPVAGEVTVKGRASTEVRAQPFAERRHEGAEQTRRRALERYGLTNGEWPEAQGVLESAARLAAQVTTASSAAIHVLTAHEQVRIAAFGAPLGRVPRSVSMCNVSMHRPEPVVVLEDARYDRELAASPFVNGETASVRFYAAVPLLADDGSPLGTLCVWSEERRPRTQAVHDGLVDLGVLVSSQLESRRASIAAQHEASLDPLTGLPNRRAALDRLEAELRSMAAGARPPATLVVFMIDVSGVQIVNDTFGHQTGDTVIAEAAKRISGSVRRQDLTARWGGDEFLVIADAGEPQLVGQLKHRIETGLAKVEPLRPGISSAERLSLRGTVGAAPAWRGCTAPQLIHAADQAMYAARRKAG